MEQDSHSDEELKKILSLKNIAVVGISKNSGKAAHYVPKYLSDNGYNITPVNPTASEILDKKCYSEISQIESQVDIVAHLLGLVQYSLLLYT